MVSLLRTLRSMRRVGLREWYRQMWYIGDAKSGTFMGRDQSAPSSHSFGAVAHRAFAVSGIATMRTRTGRRKSRVATAG